MNMAEGGQERSEFWRRMADLGRLRRREGRGSGANPFIRDTEGWRAWSEGWVAEKRAGGELAEVEQ